MRASAASLEESGSLAAEASSGSGHSGEQQPSQRHFPPTPRSSGRIQANTHTTATQRQGGRWVRERVRRKPRRKRRGPLNRTHQPNDRQRQQ